MNNTETTMRFILDRGGRFVIDKYLFKAVCMVHVPLEYLSKQNKERYLQNLFSWTRGMNVEYYCIQGTNIVMFERKFPFRMEEDALTRQLEEDVKKIMHWTSIEDKGYISIKSYHCSV